ncbi:DNA damage-regulated autophagy modulator protein 2-like [Venturia canescens]|uniref:DNA damage-regulated autophagy modulator protein 2-like n=1 Tax=Venturia canescens TaxID=32260 RepID=UPI001C9BFF93|nr:DNA damage-regulated autophagy modulator protein 2-like [Venturia canescens]XP_043279320.1 DNA damage-regulated autophagy modulator protein 2-like [Venturia canescens]XP_043279321.1 DNA damage-regulated autophagy modulator protein 2-like [Venturia canescens]XP_043279322.1 DNA damage-regulated autophagy modulator protein 2-like [Venturia canescens]
MDKPEVLGNLHYVPIVIFITFPATVITTYSIAVGLGHTEAGFPYISDTTTYAPESCIFAQFMNIAAALMSFFVYVRYEQVKECIVEFRGNDSLQKWNRAGLVFGLLTNLGLSIVANFQETSVLVVHMIGAFMCFGAGTIYFWSQAVCSYYLQPHGCSILVARARIIMAIFMTICFIVTIVCGTLSFRLYKGKQVQKWYKDDGGWDLHIVSTIAEWLCSMTFCAYTLSFAEEFKNTQLVWPKLLIYKRDRNTTSNEVLSVYQEEERSVEGRVSSTRSEERTNS